MKGLKSLFKHSGRNKGSTPEATSSQQEVRLGPAQLLGKQQKYEQESSTHQPRDQHRYAQSSASSSHGSLEYLNRRHSVQHPAYGNGDRSVRAADHAPRSAGFLEREDDTLGEDYRAYISAVSPRSIASKDSADAEFFSLGSDSRLRTGNSEMRHNEDIADRNVEQYGNKSSRPSSLGSQHAVNQIAQDHHLRRKSVAASVESLRSLTSFGGSASSVQPKYSLGTGVATEGSLIDGILPRIEDSNARHSDRKSWPTRFAREEPHISSSSRNQRGISGAEPVNEIHKSFERINEKPKKKNGTMDLREAAMSGPNDYGMKAALDGVVDLRDTEDTDQEVQWAPAVTHETVKPHQHEVVQERIYREIHNHEVFRYIQPVYQTEILPARHWVYNAKNELVEVSVDELPECTGAKQRWAVVPADREKPASHTIRSAPPVRELRILADKTYMTPEGFERRETTILHPPELEDLSNYGGPVIPIEFLHHPEPVQEESIKEEKKYDHPANGRQFTMEGFSDALPAFRPGSSSSSSTRAPTESTSSSPVSKRMSIRRKPVAATPSS